MPTEDRNTLDNIYRNLVHKRETVINELMSLDDEIFEFERVLYNLHGEGWNPSDLF